MLEIVQKDFCFLRSKLCFCNNVSSTMFFEVDKQRDIDGKRNVSSSMFPKVAKLGNIVRKHNVSATMFPEVEKQRNIDRKHNTSVSRGGRMPW